MSELRNLSQVRVGKANLLATLKTNLQDHQTQYREALEVWREQLTAALELAFANARDGLEWKTDFSTDLPKPQSYSEEYERIISLVENSLDDEFLLNTNEFESFMRDNWAWKGAFMANTSSYAVMGSR